MEKILTIAIPSYNVQKYLGNILNKFVQSSVAECLDILVINDGSTDDTSKIGKDYSEKYPDIIKIIDKENGGHGSAINAGIQNAKGFFFKLVDADDWLDDANLVKIIDRLKKLSKIDMIVCPMVEYNDKTGQKKVIKDVGQKQSLVDQTMPVERLFYNIPPMHSIIYRTGLLLEHFDEIKIDEHHFYVDVEYIIFPFVFIDKAIYLPIPLYVYRVNVAGQSTSVRSFIKNKKQHHDVLLHVNDYVRLNVPVSNKKYSILVSRVSQMIAAHFKIILLQSVSISTYRELKRFRTEVKGKLIFNKDGVNLPIKLLLTSNLLLFPLVHWMAILKAKLVRQ